jgi:hypothetical protein
MTIRKIVSTVLITAMLFFAPSMIPAKAVGVAAPCGGITWLVTDTAFAGAIITPCPLPAPTHGYIPAAFWAVFACSASIIFAGAVANFHDNRQLTYPEAWTCGLAYWANFFANPAAQQKPGRPH